MFKILILAVIQGLAELLPVSSSAHVIVAEKLLGLDPAAPQMTLLLVLLHSGTMLAVIISFWSAWAEAYFSSFSQFRRMAIYIVVATALTGFVGLGLQELIRHGFAGGWRFGTTPWEAEAAKSARQAGQVPHLQNMTLTTVGQIAAVGGQRQPCCS